MAGSSSTVTRTTNANKVKGPPTEVMVSIAWVSDDTNGTVPDVTLAGLSQYTLVEVQPIPDATLPATTAFEILVRDANTAELFASGEVAVDSEARLGGHYSLGYFPCLDASGTVELVTHADHAVAANIGNSKQLTVNLRFEKK